MIPELPDSTVPSHLLVLLECGLLVAIVLAATLWSSHRGEAASTRGGAASGARWLRLFERWRGWPGSSGALVLLAGLVGFAGNALLALALGFPEPGTDDATAYLVTAETFAAGRLVNPPAPHPALVPAELLGEPYYIGKYPPGQAALLVPGVLAGNPGYGLWLASGLLAAAMTWCFLGFFPRRWVLLGAVLVLLRLAVGGYWNQTYWGGSLAAIGGALLFGGLGRAVARGRLRSAAALGAGLGILALARPYEGALAALPVLGWLAFRSLGRLRSAPVAWLRELAALVLLLVPALGFLGLYNARVTGSPLRFVHQLHTDQRPVAGVFLWQRWVASKNHFSWTDTDLPAAERRGWWRQGLRFFAHRLSTAGYALIGPTALLAVVLSVPWWWARPHYRLALASFLVLVAGHAIVEPYFPHYSAPGAAPLWLLGLQGLRALALAPPRWFRPGRVLAGAALGIELVMFAAQLPALRDHPSEPFVRQRRVRDQLLRGGGQHLILVAPGTAAVDNGRDLDAPVLWAADLDDESTRALLELFPGRELWRFVPGPPDLLEPVARAP